MTVDRCCRIVSLLPSAIMATATLRIYCQRDAEEADKVEVAPGVTVASLRRFRTALIGPTQGLPKRRRVCR